MKLGIMQPYLFPYLGYFQLIRAVDKFVVHDDVQYIKGGWINRNRILLNNKPQLFTISVKKDSHFLNINQREFTSDFSQIKSKFLKLLHQAYRGAPHYRPVISLIEDIMSNTDKNVSSFTTHSLQSICVYLNIHTPFEQSSKIKKNNLLKGQERVIDINLALGSTHYVNPIGGTSLYSAKTFAKYGIKLSFIRTREVLYSQLNDRFVPNLSIIDVLMFNDKKSVKSLLEECDLV